MQNSPAGQRTQSECADKDSYTSGPCETLASRQTSAGQFLDARVLHHEATRPVATLVCGSLYPLSPYMLDPLRYPDSPRIDNHMKQLLVL